MTPDQFTQWLAEVGFIVAALIFTLGALVVVTARNRRLPAAPTVLHPPLPPSPTNIEVRHHVILYPPAHAWPDPLDVTSTEVPHA